MVQRHDWIDRSLIFVHVRFVLISVSGFWHSLAILYIYSCSTIEVAYTGNFWAVVHDVPLSWYNGGGVLICACGQFSGRLVADCFYGHWANFEK